MPRDSDTSSAATTRQCTTEEIIVYGSGAEPQFVRTQQNGLVEGYVAQEERDSYPQ